MIGGQDDSVDASGYIYPTYCNCDLDDCTLSSSSSSYKCIADDVCTCKVGSKKYTVDKCSCPEKNCTEYTKYSSLICKSTDGSKSVCTCTA